MVADPIEKHMTEGEIEKRITHAEQLMKNAAHELDFLAAAQIRDEILRMKMLLQKE